MLAADPMFQSKVKVLIVLSSVLFVLCFSGSKRHARAALHSACQMDLLNLSAEVCGKVLVTSNLHPSTDRILSQME